MRLGQNLNSQSVEVQSRAKAWNRNHSWYFLVGSVEFHQTCDCAYRSSQCSQCKPSGPRQRLPCRMCSSRNSFYRPFRWMTLLYRIPAIYMHLFMHNSNSQLRLFDAMLASKSFLLAPCSFVRKRNPCHKPRFSFWRMSGRWGFLVEKSFNPRCDKVIRMPIADMTKLKVLTQAELHLEKGRCDMWQCHYNLNNNWFIVAFLPKKLCSNAGIRLPSRCLRLFVVYYHDSDATLSAVKRDRKGSDLHHDCPAPQDGAGILLEFVHGFQAVYGRTWKNVF